MPFAYVSNGHKLMREAVSESVRFAPGAARFSRAVIGGAKVVIHVSICGSEEPAEEHILSSRVSFV